MKYAPQSALTSLVAATVAVLVALGAPPALAHDELVATDPVADRVLTEAPGEITMTFSGEITDVDGANQVRVTDAAGTDVASGDAEVNGSRVSQKIRGHGSEDETYTVTWRVVSSDGHPIQGTYRLTVGEGRSATESPTAGETGEPSETSSGFNTTNIVIFTAGLAAAVAVLTTVILKSRSRKD